MLLHLDHLAVLCEFVYACVQRRYVLKCPHGRGYMTETSYHPTRVRLRLIQVSVGAVLGAGLDAWVRSMNPELVPILLR